MNKYEISQEELEKIILRWWRSRKPIRWTTRKHIKYPTVNCRSHSENLLADTAGAIALKYFYTGKRMPR